MARLPTGAAPSRTTTTRPAPRAARQNGRAEGRDTAAQPWAALPREIANLLAPLLDELVDDVSEAIQQQIAEYARPRDGMYVKVIRLAVQQALEYFVQRIGNPNAPWEATAEVYRSIGRGEADEGRSLDAMQTARVAPECPGAGSSPSRNGWG